MKNLLWLTCIFDLDQSERKSTQVHARPGQTESQVEPSFQLASTCNSIWPGLKPCQTHPPVMKCFSASENDIISKEVANLLQKAVIVETSHEPGEFISSVFVQPRKDGSHRMIMNPKNLNKHVQYNHFKWIHFRVY